ASITTGFALVQRNDARSETRHALEANAALRARGLATASVSVRQSQPALAVLLTLESYRYALQSTRGATEEVGSLHVLLDALRASPERPRFLAMASSNPSRSIVESRDVERPWLTTFSPDGRLVAAASNHGALAVWDVQSRRLTAHQPAPIRSVPTSLALNR